MATGTLVGAAPLNASDDSRLLFNTGVTEAQSVALGDTDVSFVSMNTVSWTVEYRANLDGDDSVKLSIRIMSGTTVLAAADSGGTHATVQAFTANPPTVDTTVGPTAFAYVNTGATKAQWDNATVELLQDYSQNMGSDGIRWEVDFASFAIDYEVSQTPTPDQSGAISPSGAATTEVRVPNWAQAAITEQTHEVLAWDGSTLWAVMQDNGPPNSVRYTLVVFKHTNPTEGSTSGWEVAGTVTSPDNWIENWTCLLSGTKLHIVSMDNGPAGDAIYMRYHRFDTSTETWDVTNTLFHNAAAGSFRNDDYSSVTMGIRSNGVLVIAIFEFASAGGHFRGYVKSTGDVFTSIGSLTLSDNTLPGRTSASAMDGSDRLHVFINRGTRVNAMTIQANNTMTSLVPVDQEGASTNNRELRGEPFIYTHGGVEKVGVPYEDLTPGEFGVIAIPTADTLVQDAPGYVILTPVVLEFISAHGATATRVVNTGGTWKAFFWVDTETTMRQYTGNTEGASFTEEATYPGRTPQLSAIFDGATVRGLYAVAPPSSSKNHPYWETSFAVPPISLSGSANSSTSSSGVVSARKLFVGVASSSGSASGALTVTGVVAVVRVAPYSLLSLSNLSGTVADIQDDPDSADLNWLVVT